MAAIGAAGIGKFGTILSGPIANADTGPPRPDPLGGAQPAPIRGVGPGGVRAQASSCSSDAYVVARNSLSNGVNTLGFVELWYSPSCRKVAAQYDDQSGACGSPGWPVGNYCGEGIVQHGGVAAAACASNIGSTGCKTGFVNDAGISQFGFGQFLKNGSVYMGSTSPF